MNKLLASWHHFTRWLVSNSFVKWLTSNTFSKWLASENYSNWKTLFLILSFILSLYVNLSSEYDRVIFWSAIVTSVAISCSICCWGTASVPIESFRVSLGWGFINYSLFIITANPFIMKKEWGTEYVLGLLIAFICSLLLVCFCSYISYLLKLNDDKQGSSFFHLEESRFNGCIFYILFIISSLVYIVINEGNKFNEYNNKKITEQKNIQYQKENWQNVAEWHTEILNGNTIYVIKCSKGRLGIYPSKYPQIRDINKNTKIKCLVGVKKDGLIFPERLEIKN